MALLDSEVQRIRVETGYNALSVGAEPYIGYVAVFDQVIKIYLNAGATTSSSTTVAASTAGTAPAALLLASATGFAAGARIFLDVDDRQESATVQSISGSTITVLLKRIHNGTYPVTVDGGESIIREKLAAIAAAHEQIKKAISKAGLKRAEEVEWYQGKNGGSAILDDAFRLLAFQRQELCEALGVTNLRNARKMSSGGSELY